MRSAWQLQLTAVQTLRVELEVNLMLRLSLTLTLSLPLAGVYIGASIWRILPEAPIGEQRDACASVLDLFMHTCTNAPLLTCALTRRCTTTPALPS